VNEELLASAISVHGEASRAPLSAADHHLLSKSVEITKRIKPDH
jgi:hypothetical protein